MHRRYRLEIYNRGVTATTGTISYTLNSSDFATAPIAGGFSVRAAESRVESLPWQLQILDRGSTFTAKIANSSGRMHLLGRMVRLLSAIDSTASTAYQAMAIGRLTDINLAPNIADYQLTVSDERWVERQTQVYTKANTAMLVPSGLISAFHNTPATTPGTFKVRVVTGNLVLLEYLTPSNGLIPVVGAAINVLSNDVKSDAVGGNTAITVGNFVHARWRNVDTSTDYEIATFDHDRVTGLPSGGPHPTFVESFTSGLAPSPFYVWVVWAASQPSVNAQIKGYIYAPTHPPTNEFPLHIGGAAGIAPFTLVKQHYTGTYSGTTSIGVRYSTARFDTLTADQSFGRLWLRVTNPELMSDALDTIYGAYGVAPFTDSSGKIAPQPLRLPASTAISVATLLTLGSSNLDDSGHPTFEHPSGEIVNAFSLTVPHFIRNLYGGLSLPSVPTGDQLRLVLLRRPIDLISATTQTITRTHDNTTVLGRRDRAFRLPGSPVKQPIGSALTSQANLRVAGEIADSLAAQIFPRFGDGPIFSECQGMRTVDTSTRGRILPGTFVKLVLGTWPNPASLTRGSTRIMQVIERWETPIGPRFRLLDVGPNLAVLSAPALALAQSTRDTRHAVIGTVTSIPAGSKWEVQLGITSTGSTAPATGSTRWFPVVSRGTSTFTRGFLPSKSKVWGRVRAFKPNRIGSAWSTNASVVTASITAPTISGVSSITAGTAILKWANGSTRYPTEIMVDASTSATLGSSNRVGMVLARTTRFDLVGLNSNDSHKVGVRHADGYGGYSAQDTTTFTTTTGYTVAPSLKGLIVVQGA